MLNYFDKLRKKSEHDRRKAVLWISVSVTLFITIIWGITIDMRVSATDFSLKPDNAVAGVPSLADTFSNFFDQIKKISSSSNTGSSTATSSVYSSVQ